MESNLKTGDRVTFLHIHRDIVKGQVVEMPRRKRYTGTFNRVIGANDPTGLKGRPGATLCTLDACQTLTGESEYVMVYPRRDSLKRT